MKTSARSEATMTMQKATFRLDQLSTLPPALDLPVAARILGIGKSAAYELVRSGEWPTPVLRLGHRIKIPTEPLLLLLGLSTGLPLKPFPVPRTRAG